MGLPRRFAPRNDYFSEAVTIVILKDSRSVTGGTGKVCEMICSGSLEPQVSEHTNDYL
jgi:hypothetical protein